MNDDGRGDARGELDLALVTGAEALATQRALRRSRRAAAVEPPRPRGAAVPVRGAVPPGRGRARGVPGVAHLRRSSTSPAAPASASSPTTTARSIGRAAGADDARSRPPTRTPGSRERARSSDLITATPEQPHGRLPVHEVHGVGHGRRHGGRARRGHPRDGRRARRARTTSGCTCAAGATPPTRSTSPSTPTCRRSPAMAAASRRRSAAPASASTTSPTSTCTAASPARCTSPATRSASAVDDPRGRSPSPAACRSPAAPAATT